MILVLYGIPGSGKTVLVTLLRTYGIRAVEQSRVGQTPPGLYLTRRISIVLDAPVSVCMHRLQRIQTPHSRVYRRSVLLLYRAWLLEEVALYPRNYLVDADRSVEEILEELLDIYFTETFSCDIPHAS